MLYVDYIASITSSYTTSSFVSKSSCETMVGTGSGEHLPASSQQNLRFLKLAVILGLLSFLTISNLLWWIIDLSEMKWRFCQIQHNWTPLSVGNFEPHFFHSSLFKASPNRKRGHVNLVWDNLDISIWVWLASIEWVWWWRRLHRTCCLVICRRLLMLYVLGNLKFWRYWEILLIEHVSRWMLMNDCIIMDVWQWLWL